MYDSKNEKKEVLYESCRKLLYQTFFFYMFNLQKWLLDFTLNLLLLHHST